MIEQNNYIPIVKDINRILYGKKRKNTKIISERSLRDPFIKESDLISENELNKNTKYIIN